MKMNSVVHFEFPVDDRTRAARFYEKTFGWQPLMLGPEMGEYVVVTTTESDDKGPVKPGAINGGLFQRTEPSQVPSVVISVDDVRESMKQVEQAGGKASAVKRRASRVSSRASSEGPVRVGHDARDCRPARTGPSLDARDDSYRPFATVFVS
jgi:uncharacterized protein